MIEVNINELGERIKELRLERGLSQKELADKIGVATNTISQYESGKSKTKYLPNLPNRLLLWSY